MATLERLLRRAASQYKPFTQPRWRGSFPFAQRVREISHFSNGLPSLSLLSHKSLLYPASRPLKLQLYEDRRLWHPAKQNYAPRSLVESYPVIGNRTKYIDIGVKPDWRHGFPLDPTGTGEILKFVKSKTHPSGYIYIRDKERNIGWENPWKMIICLKRKMRREILAANGNLGGAHKKPKWTQFSYVRCF